MPVDEHWLRVRELVERALDLPRDRRVPFLVDACGGDEELHSEVQALLAFDEEAEEEFVPPRPGAFRSLTISAPEDGSTPTGTAGPYELLDEIGRGGMGVVFRARLADRRLERTVAVKLIRRGLDTEEILQRFERERQVLASLEHPGIARLIDGGVTDDGRQYLVMEHVEGVPIDRWCDEQRLSVDARVKLMREVCATVDSAHRSLVVHRDLKPSNILVTAGGRPKLVDFGIAKLLAPTGDTSATALTRTYSRRLTPAYASPEQLCGEPITTASDTYSLGVILYRLLVGRLPIPLKGLSPIEMERIVCEQEPPTPSAEVLRRAEEREMPGEQAPPTPEELSSRRGTAPRALSRQLEGDLDKIIAKALRKEPVRRYASAAALDEDLRLYAAGLPVGAQPDTWSYRARKFTRRNRAAVGAAGLVLIALIVGLVVSTWQYRRASTVREDLAAQLERNRERAGELQRLAVDLEAARGRADEQRLLSTERAEQLEALTPRLEEEKQRAERERGRAQENLTEVMALNLELEHQRALSEDRYRDVRELTRALLFDVQQALDEVPEAHEARELITSMAVQYLDRLARDPHAEVDLLREVAEGYSRLIKKEEERPPGDRPEGLELEELHRVLAVTLERIGELEEGEE